MNCFGSGDYNMPLVNDCVDFPEYKFALLFLYTIETHFGKHETNE